MTDTRTAFVSLAQKRMNKAIKAIRAVGELGNRKRALQEEDVAEISEGLSNELNEALIRLAHGIEAEPDFRLGAKQEE